MLATERTKRYFKYGGADLQKVAHAALMEAAAAHAAKASAPAPPAAYGGGGVKRESWLHSPAQAVATPAKRSYEESTADSDELRAKRLAALAARGVDTGVHPRGASGDARDGIIIVD